MADTPQSDWRPLASADMLHRRAALLAAVRNFFAERGVLEVETPALCQAGVTDPNLSNPVVDCTVAGDARRFYLQTSPEYAMKRLLAAGSGSIYQVSKVFRDGEAGRLHNPEFTLLEWYRPGHDYEAIMDETAVLLHCVLGAAQPIHRMTYREAFQRFADLDPLHEPDDTIARRAQAAGAVVVEPGSMQRDQWLDLLLGVLVAPRLGLHGPVFLTEFPASQAALARLKPDDPAVAERFEVFIDGVEIANGFHELTDSTEQRRRFEQDLAIRRQRGLSSVPIDERLLSALEAGLPSCSGVALGLDRLLMVATGAKSLREVLAFNIENA